jgi:hypothetical protein
VEDPRALDVQVELHDVDELRARAVGGLGDRAGHVELRRLGSDGDDLARLNVGGEANDEVGVAAQRVLVEHPRLAFRPATERRRRLLPGMHGCEGTHDRERDPQSAQCPHQGLGPRRERGCAR